MPLRQSARFRAMTAVKADRQLGQRIEVITRFLSDAP